jgi:hypothetical protein
MAEENKETQTEIIENEEISQEEIEADIDKDAENSIDSDKDKEENIEEENKSDKDSDNNIDTDEEEDTDTEETNSEIDKNEDESDISFDEEEDEEEEIQQKSGLNIKQYLTKKNIIIGTIVFLLIIGAVVSYIIFGSSKSDTTEHNTTKSKQNIIKVDLDKAVKPKQIDYKFEMEDIDAKRLNLKLALLTKLKLVDDEEKLAEETYRKAMQNLKIKQLAKLKELEKIQKEEAKKIEDKIKKTKLLAKEIEAKELAKIEAQKEARAKELEKLKQKEQEAKIKLEFEKEKLNAKLQYQKEEMQKEQELKKQKELSSLKSKKDDLVLKASNWLTGQMESILKEDKKNSKDTKPNKNVIKAKEVVVNPNKKVTLIQVFTVRKLDRYYVKKIADAYDASIYACIDKKKRIRLLVGPYESKKEFARVKKLIRKKVAKDAYPVKMRYGDLKTCGKLKGKSSI